MHPIQSFFKYSILILLPINIIFDKNDTNFDQRSRWQFQVDHLDSFRAIIHKLNIADNNENASLAFVELKSVLTVADIEWLQSTESVDEILAMILSNLSASVVFKDSADYQSWNSLFQILLPVFVYQMIGLALLVIYDCTINHLRKGLFPPSFRKILILDFEYIHSL